MVILIINDNSNYSNDSINSNNSNNSDNNNKSSNINTRASTAMPQILRDDSGNLIFSWGTWLMIRGDSAELLSPS